MNITSKFLRFAVGTVLTVSMVAGVYAQGPGGGGRGPGGGGRGGFGMGMGMGGGSLNALVRMEEVQKELKMTEAQVEEYTKIAESLRGGGGGRGFGNFQDMTDDERTKMREERQKAAAEADEKLETVLDPDQFDRLVGLFAQQANADSLTNKFVASRVGLSDEKVEEIKTKQTELNEESMAQMREQFQNGGPQANGGDFRERMETARKERDEKVLALLSDEEKAKFEALKGEKFTFPERGLGGGRGPGGFGGGQGGFGGGQGGPGGRRQRPE